MLSLAFRSFFGLLPQYTKTALAKPSPILAFLFWLYINATGYYIIMGGQDAQFYDFGFAGLFAYAGILLLLASFLEAQLNLPRYSLATLFFLQQAVATVYLFLIYTVLPKETAQADALARFSFLLAFAGHLRIYLFLSKTTQAGLRYFATAVIFSGAILIQQLGLLDFPMWYAATVEQAEEDKISLSFNPEQVLAEQPELLANALEHVEASNSSSLNPKLYYLGFAAYGGQQVFMREEKLARDKVAARFHSENTSLTLINQPSTVLQLPLANRTNLRSALAALATKMNTENDVLWLFLTSHGEKNEGVAINFYPFPFDASLPPAELKSMLDEAGIKWRVIVVSACYSGYYVPALQNENTLVLTAASADTSSFGCDDSEQFTYFGRALYDESFDQHTPLEIIFNQAIERVSAREQAEKIDEPSRPQLFIGQQIKLKLEQLQTQLTH